MSLFLTHATHTKISTHNTHAKTLWTHHPCQNFNACHPCYPCQNLTHATHKPMPSMPPMNPCYSHHPRYLADSIWNIRTVWQKKLYIRLDIVKNLCLIFRTQNVLILCILLIPLDQIILIAFVNKIYIYWEYQNSLAQKIMLVDLIQFKSL